jgi:hypothetical protein
MKATLAVLQRKPPQSGTDEELDKIEQQFVLDFCQMMGKGNYQMLSQDYWDLAMAEDFSLLTPIEIEFDKLDNTLLTTFLNKHGPSMPVLQMRPNFATQVLIFRNGFGSASITNRFIDSKLNMLLNKLIGLDHSSSDPSKLTTDEVPNAEQSSSSGGPVRYAERQTLQNALPTWPSIMKGFLSKITIVEPTFKQLVLLFRNDDPSAPRNIQIRTYRDIPMSDIEGVFPHVKLHFRTYDVVQLVASAVVAAVAIAKKLKDGKVGGKFVASIIVLIVMKAISSYNSMQKTKQKTRENLTKILATKMLDNGKGVLLELLDSMEEQEVKEVLLGYWALHKAGPAGLTEKELDEYVEGFLLNEFELRVDFECDDAIRKLAEKKLVVSRGGRWSAVPVQEGLEMLGREWRAAERR